MDERFVVIGAGTMGVGIGYVAAGAGYRVELVEVDAARAESALRTMSDLWERAVSRGRLEAAAAADARGRVSVVGTVEALAPEPAVVVEAVPERVDLKRGVLRAAEVHRPQLLASNTSSIPIGALADGLEHPDLLVGMHFFNPVWAMPLLEIVVGEASAQGAVDAALAVASRLGKDPILVRDLPGFATSRLGVALGLEAIRMVADGVATPADIDKAMVLGYRHPMGPLELTDVVGLDVRLDIARTLEKAYGARFAPPPLLVDMVAGGRLGRKSGEGFYRWEAGRKTS
jgi:3-hydroxybutyryl-CoA dehydrogenase